MSVHLLLIPPQGQRSHFSAFLSFILINSSRFDCCEKPQASNSKAEGLIDLLAALQASRFPRLLFLPLVLIIRLISEVLINGSAPPSSPLGALLIQQQLGNQGGALRASVHSSASTENHARLFLYVRRFSLCQMCCHLVARTQNNT